MNTAVSAIQNRRALSDISRSLFRVVYAFVLIILYVFLLAPIIVVVITSFETQSYLSFPPEGFTLDWYAKVLTNQQFIQGFQVSLVVATVAALLALALGVPAALALSRRFPGNSALSTFFISPLIVPTVVLGLALLLVLAPLGLTGSYPGLVTAHMVITIPYVVRTVLVSLQTQDLTCSEAARTLGATGWMTFRRVTLPLITPGIFAGAAIAFIISFDEAAISLFVVGPGATTLPAVIFNAVQYQTDPQISALSVLLILLSGIFIVTIDKAIGLKNVMSS